jgi:hypothetical protein
MNTSNTNTTATIGEESCNAISGGGQGAKPRRPMADLLVLEREALRNALSGQSAMNYRTIIDGFSQRGIDPQDIRPRYNVFTFHAWCAQGRCVRRGEHGVKICTFVPMTRTDPNTGEISSFRGPKQTTVFHISQTEPLAQVQPAVAS